MKNQQYMDMSDALRQRDIEYINDQSEAPDGYAAFVVSSMDYPTVKAYLINDLGISSEEVYKAPFNNHLGLGGYVIYIKLPDSK